MRYFCVIYLTDKRFNNLIEGIRLLADPNQKHRAHITLRGPYEGKKPNSVDLERWTSMIRDNIIEIEGSSAFLNNDCNTVYLKCKNADFLKTIWNKKDYKQFQPHITIYNNNDKVFADELLKVLNTKGPKFSFKPGKVELLKSENDDELGFAEIKHLAGFDNLSENLNEKISIERIESLSNQDRIKYISRLCDRLVQ